MTNTAVDKEKVEKRRALGRGLESLLPGPRAVAPGQSGGAVNKQQVPHFVRNDKGEGEVVPGVIQAVAADTVEESVADRAMLASRLHEAALRSAGPSGTAVPTQTDSAQASKFPPFAKDAKDGAPISDLAAGEGTETITIYAQAESRMPANLVVNLEIADD